MSKLSDNLFTTTPIEALEVIEVDVTNGRSAEPQFVGDVTVPGVVPEEVQDEIQDSSNVQVESFDVDESSSEDESMRQTREDILANSMKSAGLEEDDLPVKVTDTVVKDIAASTGVTDEQMEVALGSNTSISNVSQLADVVEDVREVSGMPIGNESLLNTVTGSLVTVGAETGDSGMLTSLFNNANDTGFMQSSLVGSISSILDGDEWDALWTIVDLVGGDSVLGTYPKLVRDVLSRYKFPRRTTREDYPSLLSQLRTDLLRIDRDWAYYYRNGQKIFNLEPFVYASNDARILLSMDTEFFLPVRIAPDYPPTRLQSLAEYAFDKVPIFRGE